MTRKGAPRAPREYARVLSGVTRFGDLLYPEPGGLDIRDLMPKEER